MKILVIEDHFSLAEDIQQFLQQNGFVVEITGFLDTAREKVNLYQYDLVIIDIGLPDGSGLEIIKLLKENNDPAGILVVTAKNAVEDKVRALELGADDYITKPFHKAELNARVRSIIRRGKFQGNNVVTFNEIKIDISAAQVYVNDKPLKLTRKEFDLLLYFMYNRDHLLTKESITEHLWGDQIDQSDSFDFIYNHIKNLRKKMLAAGGNNYIRAMYGMGYKFSDQ